MNGYVQAVRQGGSTAGRSIGRVVFGTTCYVLEVAGAILLAVGLLAGLYTASISMIVLLAYGISGAWLLLVGVHRQLARGKTAA